MRAGARSSWDSGPPRGILHAGPFARKGLAGCAKAVVTRSGSRPGPFSSAALLAAPKAAVVTPSGSRPGRTTAVVTRPASTPGTPSSAALLAPPHAAVAAPPATPVLVGR